MWETPEAFPAGEHHGTFCFCSSRCCTVTGYSDGEEVILSPGLLGLRLAEMVSTAGPSHSNMFLLFSLAMGSSVVSSSHWTPVLYGLMEAL